MNPIISKHWKVALLILTLLLVSSACKLAVGDTPAAKQSPNNKLIAQGDVVFGPGPFNLPETIVGLSDLSSYKATLTLSFAGTNSGQPNKWSTTYVMLATKDPAARQLTIENAGDISDPASVFMAEVEGAAYERQGKNSCLANLIVEGHSPVAQMEPAGFLTGVIGADVAGSETVNGAAANHYTFDERAVVQLGLPKSTGEVWVASEGGYIVKYLLTTKGAASYFGEGIEGTLTWDYELADVNKPVKIKLPADCPPGKVNAPQLPDASNVVNMPGLLAYDTASSPADAAAFYQKQIPGLGWKLLGKPSITDTTTLLSFTQGDQEIIVIITAADGATKVHIVLGKAQK